MSNEQIPQENKKLQIRNSTAEFLVFTSQAGENTIEVRVQDETVWLSQKMIGTLFNCSSDNVSLHLKNIFKEGELSEKAVTEEFSATASDGKKYKTKFYNLDAIISVGYRVNSQRATQFRQWATSVLRDFAIRGYVLDVGVPSTVTGELKLLRPHEQQILEYLKANSLKNRLEQERISQGYASKKIKSRIT